MKRASFNDPFKGEKGCYHLSSSHLEKQSLFRSDSDFIFGVNTQALLLPLFDVSLIAVVLRIAQHSAGQYEISGILNSEDVYFNAFVPSGIKAGSVSVRGKRIIFKTHIPVPDDYEFVGGRIMNKSFVSYETASRRFRDSVEYFDCLRKFSLESIVESEHGIHESISFSDQELRERIFVMTYLLPKDSEDRPGDILSALRLWNAI